VVFCRLRYRLTLRDLSEILLFRGFIVSHEAMRDWEAKLLPILGDARRKRRHSTRRGAGTSWYVDETQLKVRGRWCYLYRAIDLDGNLTDAMLSEQRDMRAVKAFFRSAKATMGFRPDRVTTDGHGSYPRAIRTVQRGLAGEALGSVKIREADAGIDCRRQPGHVARIDPVGEVGATRTWSAATFTR
jgi:putative transposase